MAGFTLHPFETSVCLWTLLLSLLVCMIMGLMKKVLVRNCILFFFWFMTNAVFEVLEITALGREDVLVYRTLIQTVYIINTFVITLGLAAGIRYGLRNILRFTKEEWLYIGINGLAVFAAAGAAIMFGIAGKEGLRTLPVILWIIAGSASVILAAVCDLTVFARLHRRLRRSSPHMLYVFSTALFFACVLIPPVFGLSFAGPVFTIMMILFLVFYMLGRMYRLNAAAQPAGDTPEAPAPADAPAAEEKVRIVKEFVRTDDASLLAQNPHFIANTLNSICYQIDHDAEQSKKSVSDLAEYMQGKYNSLRADHMIPFETELKTVNRYLALQKTRFEDQLNLVTDYQAGGFLLPPLSLITVVEHVVSNILQYRPDGGTLRLETDRNDTETVIRVVCDDDINDADSLAHVCEAFPLLKTVAERLDRFCGGTFRASRENEKSVFTIRIPVPEDPEPESEGAAPAPADAV